MLFVALLGIALAGVPLFGGKLSKLADVRFRMPSLIVVAFAIQLVIVTIDPGGSATLHEALHVFSYALIVVFLVRNHGLPGMKLIASGTLMNVVAIAANHGLMPASKVAYAAAGIPTHRGDFANSTVVANAHLRFLGDVFSVPRSWPLHNVFSIGDVLLVIGAVVMAYRLCGVRGPGRGLVRRRVSAGNP